MRQILRNNDEIRMTKPRKDIVVAGVSRCLYTAKLEGMTKCSNPLHRYMVISFSRFNDSTIQRFNVTKSFVIRYSCFVIFSS
jgi:hypothetical protein